MSISARSLATAVVCLALLVTSSPAQTLINNIEARVVGPVVTPDTINGLNGMIPAGATVTVIISNQTSGELESFSAGFRIYSPDASVNSLTYPSPAMLLPEWPNSGANFLGAIQVNSTQMDGLLPDLLYSSWVIFFPGGPYYSSPDLTDVVSFSFSSSSDDSGIICIDSSFFPPAGEWFVTTVEGASTVPPEWGASVGGYPDGGLCFTIAQGLSCCQVAGDANHDGSSNIADVVFMIDFIFHGGAPPVCCEEMDANHDGSFQIGDVVYLLAWHFKGGPAPQCGFPGMTCGG